MIGIDADDAIPCSAKTGEGIDEILEAVVHRMPAPRGNPDGAAARHDHRLLVRQLRRRRHAGPRRRRPAPARRADPHDGERRRLRRRPARRVHAEIGGARPADRRRGGLPDRRHQGAPGGQGRRHDHAREEAAEQRRRRHRAAAGLQGDPAAGLRRPLPDRGERVRPAPRRPGEAQAQRLVAALRARGEPGARLRLSLRLPRPAPHGDRPGAARARVRPGPDHDRAVGRLRGPAQQRRR